MSVCLFISHIYSFIYVFFTRLIFFTDTRVINSTVLVLRLINRNVGIKAIRRQALSLKVKSCFDLF